MSYYVTQKHAIVDVSSENDFRQQFEFDSDMKYFLLKPLNISFI